MMNFIDSQAAVVAATAAASLDEHPLGSMDGQELSGAKQFVVGLVGALIVAPFVLIAINAGVFWSIDRAYEARTKALVGKPLPAYKAVDTSDAADTSSASAAQ